MELGRIKEKFGRKSRFFRNRIFTVYMRTFSDGFSLHVKKFLGKF